MNWTSVAWDEASSRLSMRDGMTNTPHHSTEGNRSELERWPSWLGMVTSVVVHGLILLILLHAAKTRIAPPQGGGMGGARVPVQFIGQPAQGEKRPVTPNIRRQPTEQSSRQRPSKKAPPIQATRVTKAENPLMMEKDPFRIPEIDDGASRQRLAQPPVGAPNAPRATAPTGQAPGLPSRETAETNNSPARGETRGKTQGPPAPGSEPRMDVDGHQIYYDVRNENWLLDWQDQGMTELYFPLPGRKDFMVCPLEIVARRSSGGCRLVQPDDPELPKIGDARKVVHVVRVYRRGELIWQGPGAYR